MSTLVNVSVREPFFFKFHSSFLNFLSNGSILLYYTGGIFYIIFEIPLPFVHV